MQTGKKTGKKIRRVLPSANAIVTHFFVENNSPIEKNTKIWKIFVLIILRIRPIKALGGANA